MYQSGKILRTCVDYTDLFWLSKLSRAAAPTTFMRAPVEAFGASFSSFDYQPYLYGCAVWIRLGHLLWL